MYAQELTLDDGRILAYSQVGLTSGSPVVYFHGTPGSRLETIGDAQFAASLGLRLIAMERPGFGRSTFQANRKLDAWQEDVTRLADHLDLMEFSVMGYSSGGPYAALCASLLSERISSLTLISPIAPFSVPGVIDDLIPENLALYELCKMDPAQAELLLSGLVGNADALIAATSSGSAEPDQSLFATQAFRESITDNLLECVHLGVSGVVSDISLLSSFYEIDTSKITSSTTIWHGDADINAPISMGQYWANAIPGSKFNIVKNAGHFFRFSKRNEILHELSTVLRSQGC